MRLGQNVLRVAHGFTEEEISQTNEPVVWVDHFLSGRVPSEAANLVARKFFWSRGSVED